MAAMGITMHAPRLRIYRGYTNGSGQYAIDPWLSIHHPIMAVPDLGAEAVLMVYSKRRGRIGATSTKRHPTYTSGWGEARGKRATTAPLTATTSLQLDVIRQFILNHCLCGAGFTEAQMEAMTLSAFEQSDNTYRFGFKGKHNQNLATFKCKKSRLFGIAMRYENPEWTDNVTGTVAETTREVTIEQNTITRYRYTEVAPFRVHINVDWDGYWRIGIQLQPINGPKG